MAQVGVLTSVPITDMVGGHTLSSSSTEKVTRGTVNHRAGSLVCPVTTVILSVTDPASVDTETSPAGELLQTSF